mmetsp:Transcript_67536/g.170426  ORF Transcript_67536/g.170426 Transcript_67536/m.170426 type:complete len:327 (+) Transcript_67536:72-1052(+)|eukprot:CAMPEP_0115536282 /NCGR_PEP_ID=MMETSP0271-20121206/87691_1 /TAXON_ID=71861 /ORGANISM="Scrippsiella trochoidea, Strain CCMP3099" /LENGTH=326 /DNA_ID=CAMNT_0002968959 /DNA_START=28 /DNA_END=1008 /DNA_ORIENTATION=+
MADSAVAPAEFAPPRRSEHLETETPAAAPRRSVSLSGGGEGSGVRAYTPTLWQARIRQTSGERPKQERDSLRSRSNEGRPGSRKHRRWTRSQELVGSLRRAIAAAGEDFDEVGAEGMLKEQLQMEWRPSIFYRLLEFEGPSGALEAWAAAESVRVERRERPRSRPRRPKSDAQVSMENERAARHTFGDNWNYVHSNAEAKEFLAELETMATEAFSAEPSRGASGGETSKEPSEWLLHWDGEGFVTSAGAPPAAELAISGLSSAQRKVVHQFAELLGLHSESRHTDATFAGVSGEKVLTLRPPRRLGTTGRAWVAPISVARVLAAAA